ncbi:MAG: MiaB/RimO family radical SAM methylthiotransferase [Gemmatimonadaceae bacterium]
MKVYLRTFGCRANHYDTEAVRAMVTSSGHEIVASVTDADAAVFNSCAVTAAAEAELRKVVRRAARERPALRSVVMGCAAALDDSRDAARRIRDLPTVGAVVGGADLPSVAVALGLPASSRGPGTTQTSTRALLRIQDGCDEHCTFCATTIARGDNRSRAADALIDEAQALAASHAEIVITGIHIGSYGSDAGSSLGALLTRLVRDVPAARFRLSSIEATEIDARVADLLVSAPDHVVPHIHAPLQSGSDRLLRRMGRHWYTSATYSAAVERLASEMGALGLGADVITGFPGETDADHAQTIATVERLPFTYLHVFPYSERPGTAAARLANRVSPAVAGARAAALRSIASRKAAQYEAARIGGLADVIVVGGGDRRQGLTGDYLTVLPADATRPRGARFTARLERGAASLVARPVPS